MSTTKQPNGDQPPPSRIRECVPCDLDRFCRNHYFTGKLLTARDLTLEQRYMRDKLRLHHRVLHGWGVACGLRVKPHPYCPDLRLVVEPGVAIDKCGYEIVVPMPVEIELPKPARKRPRPASPCPPEEQAPESPKDKYGEQWRHQHGAEKYGTSSEQKYDSPSEPKYDSPSEPKYGYPSEPKYDSASEPKYGYPSDPKYDSPSEPKYGYPSEPTYGSPSEQTYGHSSEYKPSRDPCDPPEPCIPLTVCVRYAECEEEFAPAPFDECGCNGPEGRQPNRICEGFAIELKFEEPKRIDPCYDGDCEELFARALEPCPRPEKPNCIPLAFIEDYRPGETVVEARINNRDYRPLLLSTHLIERVLRCLAERAPGQTLTRVQYIGWTHGHEYNCHDFFKFFTGESESEGSFDVRFEAPVRTDAWNRTFQALIVRHRGLGPVGPLEVAPSRVWSSQDGRRCYLQIDRSWAQRELDETGFDVYLSLRCSLILDDKGRPVDGDLLARLVDDDKYLVEAPTGNGLPGGTLESWICVRP